MKADAPLLVGAVATRAFEALDRGAAWLASVPLEEVPDASLAQGAAGMAVAHAHLDAWLPGRGHAARAAAAIERAADLVETRPHLPWLLEGVAGVAWAFECLRPLTDASDQDDPNQSLDDELTTSISASSRVPLEWMHGIAGVAAYVAARTARSRGAALGRAIVARLVGEARHDERGAYWTASTPTGGIDDGFAHGVPGIVAALATLDRDAGTMESRALMRAAVRRLLAAHDANSTRTAYCYGDPGVAWSVLAAAAALREPSMRATALSLAKAASKRRDASARVHDAAFCHGAFGLGHLFGRMHAATGETSLRDAAAYWFERGLAMPASAPAPFALEAIPSQTREPRAPFRAAGLLSGVAGIVLALGDALSLPVPGATALITRRWDEPLLGAPPQGS